FFFQAEDGIRDLIVTGVQTCALPILPNCADFRLTPWGVERRMPRVTLDLRMSNPPMGRSLISSSWSQRASPETRRRCSILRERRSEERRVGKECRVGRVGGT